VTERSLKRNKKDGDVIHISVIYSMKIPAGLDTGSGCELMDRSVKTYEQAKIDSQ
jgi:hypothetical protein